MLKTKGFTLIDVLVGSALMIIVFGGIFGAYRLGLKVVSQSKARIVAVTIANQKIEEIRNLSYKQVGTQQGEVSGSILDQVTTTVNNIEYTIITTVAYIDDCFDGTLEEKAECPEKAGQDLEPSDYKRVTVRVSWSGIFSDEVVLTTDVSSKKSEAPEGCGILSISIFDASGQEVEIGGVDQPSPCPPTSIHIINENTGLDKCYRTDPTNPGHRSIILPKSQPGKDYQIIVQKEGYNKDQTYSETEDNPNPDNGHVTITEGGISPKTFYIDLVSSKNVQIVQPEESTHWEDSDFTKVASSSNIEIIEGEVKLARSDSEYESSGFLVSTTISPEFLKNWKQLSWSDNQPIGTNIKYELLYFDGNNWIAIPGFDNSPTDLSDLDVDTYNDIRLKAELTTEDPLVSPVLSDWAVDWISYIPNISFRMHSKKIIGTDPGEGTPIYKYDEILTTDSKGFISVEELEWGWYNIPFVGPFTSPTEEFDLSSSCPAQSVYLEPGSNLATDITLVPHQSHTLLVVVKDSAGNLLTEEAQVRLCKTGYDKTLTTDQCSQVFFTPLSKERYEIEITASGYETYSNDSIDVEGQTALEVKMAGE